MSADATSRLGGWKRCHMRCDYPELTALAVGNPGPVLGLPWELVGTGAGLVPVSQFWRGPILQPWADCPASTSELIGEDSLGGH